MLSHIERLKEKPNSLFYLAFSVFAILLAVRESSMEYLYDFLPVFGRSIPFFILTIMLYYIYILKGGSAEKLGVNWPIPSKSKPKQLVWILIRATLIFICGLLLGSIVMELFDILGHPRAEVLERMAPLVGNPMLGSVLFPVMFVVVMAEEVLFRGLFMNYLAQIWGNTNKGWILAIFISSLIFGLLHFWQGSRGMVGTGITALIFGFGYYFCKRNIWPIVLAHLAGNTISLIALATSN
jgi:membrane protease YdiL (CAAX protease family)